MIRRQKSKSYQMTEKLRQIDEECEDYEEYECSSSSSDSNSQCENDPVLSTYIRPYSKEVNNSAMHSFAMMSTVISKHISEDEKTSKVKNAMYRGSNIQSRIVHPVVCKRDIYISDRHHDKGGEKRNKTSRILKSVSISGSMLFRQKKMPKRHLADMSNTKRYTANNPNTYAPSNSYEKNKESPMSHKERNIYFGDVNKSAAASSITTNTMSSCLFEDFDSMHDINLTSEMSI